MELPRLPPPPPRQLPPPPPLSPPPGAAPGAASASPALARPGQLTPGWRITFGIGWTAVVLAIAALWKTSRVVGLATWWLGPPGEPRPIVVSVVPPLLAVLVVVATVRRMRYLPWVGVVASLGLLGVAVGDAGRFEGIAAVESSIAVAALSLSVAAFAGLVRTSRPTAGSARPEAEPRTP